MLKAEKRFLYELNTVAGEQTIKASRFALIYADLVVIAHTNEYEYNSYFGNKENEAMIDRIFVVRVPYNLRLTEEIKIYEKLIGQSQLSDARTSLKAIHIAPHTLRTASMFAILTRLKASKKSGLSLMTKLKLYDGEKQVGDWDQKHIRELQEEFMDEGMSGVSARFVINRISAALVKGGKATSRPSMSCVACVTVFRSTRRARRSIGAYSALSMRRVKTTMSWRRKKSSARLSTVTKKAPRRCWRIISTTWTPSATAPR